MKLPLGPVRILLVLLVVLTLVVPLTIMWPSPTLATGSTMEDLTTYNRVDTIGTTNSVAELHVLLYDADADSGATWTEETLDANDVGTDDFGLIASLADADPVGDCTYFLCNALPSYLRISVGTAGVGTYVAGSITWEYWNGAWTSLAGITDGTGGFKTAGNNNVTYTIPTDALVAKVNEISGYAIRARFSGTGKTMTTRPLGSWVTRGGRLFVTPSRCRTTGISTNEDTYIYKTLSPRLGGSTDFDVYFSFVYDSRSGTTNFASVALFALTQTVDDLTAEDVANRSWWLLELLYYSGADYLTLAECDQGTQYSVNILTSVTPNTRYYVHLFYDADGDTYGLLDCKVYLSLADMLASTNAVGNNHLHLHENTQGAPNEVADKASFLYAGPTWSYHASIGTTFSYAVGDLYINETSPSVFAESNVAFPMNWTDIPDLTAFDTWSLGVSPEGNTHGNVLCREGTWPGDGVTTAIRLKADEANNEDNNRYMAPSSSVFAGCIAQADVWLVSLGDGKERVLFGMADIGRSTIAVSIVRSGSSYRWRIRYNATTGIVTQTSAPYDLSLATSYNVTLALTNINATTTAGRVHLYVNGQVVASVAIALTMYCDLLIGGNPWAATPIATIEGGEAYVKGLCFKDGVTFAPKIARGGANDGTLVYTQNVHSGHLIATPGVAYQEVYVSTDDGDTWECVAKVGPEDGYQPGWLWPVWDSVNSEWLFFRMTSHATLGDQAHLYHLSDASLKAGDLDGATIGDATWTLDDCALFPTRIIESGQLLITKEVNTEQYATMELGDDYTVTVIGTISDTLLGYGSRGEPFVYRRPSDNRLCCILRYDSAPPRDEFLHVDISAGGDGTSWSVAIWPGEDWSDISASLKAFMFRGNLWIMGRDSQYSTSANWQSLVWKCDPETLNLVTERTWSDAPGFATLWETGNGDIDASDAESQSSGVYQLDVTFDLGIASFRQVSTGKVLISVDMDPVDYNFGIVSSGSTLSTGLDYFTLTNTGVNSVDITIGGTDMTGGGTTWTLSDTAEPGSGTYGLYAGLEGDSYSIVVRKTSPYNLLVSDLEADEAQKFGLQILTPTSNMGTGEEVSNTTTLTVTQHL